MCYSYIRFLLIAEYKTGILCKAITNLFSTFFKRIFGFLEENVIQMIFEMNSMFAVRQQRVSFK